MDKPFLVYWVGPDGQALDRESLNVNYACLVYAESKEKALDKYMDSPKRFNKGAARSSYGCEEMRGDSLIR